MNKISNFLTISDAAEYLGISADTLRRWDRAGKLKARRHPASSYRLYLRSTLDDFLRKLDGKDTDSSKPRNARKKKRKRG